MIRLLLEEQSDPGLHCLLRPICPNTSNYYSILGISRCLENGCERLGGMKCNLGSGNPTGRALRHL